MFAAYGGEDFLDAGAGDDLLLGGAGDDETIGGSGRDTFLFFPTHRYETTSELDRILDFRSGEDRLDLTPGGWTARSSTPTRTAGSATATTLSSGTGRGTS